MAVMAVVACEPINIVPHPVVDVNFGGITINAGNKSAEVRVANTYLTLDGERYDDVNIWVEYTLINDDQIIAVTEYTKAEDGSLTFVLDNLTPLTSYVAYVVVDGGKYGKHTSDKIGFSPSKEYIPFSGMNYKAVAQAKGIIAELHLSNLQYIYEDEHQKISSVKVEYGLKNNNKRVSKEFAASALTDGALSLNLPFEGEEYLVENRDYVVSVTLAAENLSDTFSAEVCEFKTAYAEITAAIAKPELSYDASGIHASVANVEIFYDGVSDKVYKSRYTAYYAFQYREAGKEAWTKVDADAENGTMSTIIISALINKGTTYEFKASLTAGVNNTPCESEVAEISIPEDVVVPTPPVEGGGDTSSVAGTWHLTQWRGTKPSFEVYIDITEEGVVTLWQKIEHREWECYYSTANIENGIISGVYSDGVAWGSSYYVTASQSSMTWVAVNDSTDISVYTRSSLPENLEETRVGAIYSAERFL